MTARLIVNADDFGLTHGINRAVAELHSAGALSSATLMANGAAFDDAVAIAQARPMLGVGCHVVLVDGTPISPPDSIRSLIGADGKCFRATLTDFMQALLLGRIREEDIIREALAQVERLQRAGISVTHLDSHKHAHVFPSVSSALLQVAVRCGVGAIRKPFEPEWSLALGLGGWQRQLAVRMIGSLRQRFEVQEPIRNMRVYTTDGTAAISATGKLEAETLAVVLRALPATGTYEVCCHPGYNDRELAVVKTRLRDEREVERMALLTAVPQALIGVNAPRLIHYGNLTDRHDPAVSAASVAS